MARLPTHHSYISASVVLVSLFAVKQDLKILQREAVQLALAAFSLKVTFNHYLSSINLTADAA